MNEFRIVSLGDTAVSVEFENKISPQINAQVQSLMHQMENEKPSGVLDLNPTYRALLITYDPCVTTADAIGRRVRRCLRKGSRIQAETPRVFYIPVCYGGDLGEDLDSVAEHAGMTPEEVIALHSQPEYLIYMLGFLPGFSYLGGLDARLNTPRLPQPRTLIPAGSVGIGGAQTGIYPLPSPAGWRLIGRTPLKPYDPKRQPEILYRAGDYIKFCPITREEYDRIVSEVENGRYQYQIGKKEAEK